MQILTYFYKGKHRKRKITSIKIVKMIWRNNYIMQSRLSEIKQTLQDARNDALLGKYQ